MISKNLKRFPRGRTYTSVTLDLPVPQPIWVRELALHPCRVMFEGQIMALFGTLIGKRCRHSVADTRSSQLVKRRESCRNQDDPISVISVRRLTFFKWLNNSLKGDGYLILKVITFTSVGSQLPPEL